MQARVPLRLRGVEREPSPLCRAQGRARFRRKFPQEGVVDALQFAIPAFEGRRLRIDEVDGAAAAACDRGVEGEVHGMRRCAAAEVFRDRRAGGEDQARHEGGGQQQTFHADFLRVAACTTQERDGISDAPQPAAATGSRNGRLARRAGAVCEDPPLAPDGTPMTTVHIALVTAAAARPLDDDLVPLATALREAGAAVAIVEWDDPAFDWGSVDLAVLRSPWDYTERPAAFLAWAERAAAATRLLNPPAILRWNLDKHYLADLERAGVAIVPSRFVEPGDDAAMALDAFLAEFPDCDDIVAKPCIGAGSRDAQRHGRDRRAAMLGHVERLLAARRSVLLQPYLARIDAGGETALMHFDGAFSHAIRKGPLLRRDVDPTSALFAAEQITRREASADERALAQRALAAIPFAGPLAYARVDLIRNDDAAPVLLELELAEPSLFFAHGEGSAARFADVLLDHARRAR